MTAHVAVDAMVGVAAPPRENGELVFAEPWHARVFGLAVALVEARGLEWSEFQRHLIAQVEATPDRPYYESWALALEDLVVSLGLSSTDAITAAVVSGRGDNV